MPFRHGTGMKNWLTIELISSMTSHGGQVWTLRHIYVCTCEWPGGKSRYEKMTDQEWKIPSKKMGCPCNIMIKCYPNTEIVLGCYKNKHNHPIEIANAPFMHLTARSRVQIRKMVVQKIDPREIVHNPEYLLLHIANWVHQKVSAIQKSAPQHG